MSPTSPIIRAPIDTAREALSLLGERPIHSSEVVQICVDGHRVFGLFEVDLVEGERRKECGLGSVTETELLHALFSLPYGLPTDIAGMTPQQLFLLNKSGKGLVNRNSKDVTRIYQPAGRLVALVSVARTIVSGLRCLSMYPPIYSRGIFCASQRGSGGSTADLDVASQRGIGVVLQTSDGPTSVLEWAKPVLGVPAVYRWWLSELAYRETLRIGRPLE